MWVVIKVERGIIGVSVRLVIRVSVRYDKGEGEV